MKKTLALLLLLVPLWVCAQSPIGKWNGKLAVSSQMQLRLIIEIQEKNDAYTTKLISVDQGNAEIPGDKTTVDKDNLTVNFSAMGASYTATISDNTLDGTFTQGGKDFPLIMKRADNNDDTKSNRPQTPVAPYPYNQQDVEFTNRIEGNTLSGTLTIPKDQVIKTAVVLISGSGPQNRDEELFGHKPFLVLADHLSRNGVAVLRYDDRGVGKSSKTETEGTTADLAYDAEAAVEYLRNNYDFERIGVIGHSEGGLIAFMLSGNESYKTPDFVVSIAGPGLRGADVLNGQQERALTRMGLPSATIDQTMALNKSLYAIILESTQNDIELAAKLEEQLKVSVPANVNADAAKKKISQTIAQVTAPWLYYFIKYDPSESISNTKCPVLAINGSLDSQVIASENLHAIENALKVGGNENFKIVELEGLNHLFQPAKTGEASEYAEIEITFDKKALVTISEWIKSQRQ